MDRRIIEKLKEIEGLNVIEDASLSQYTGFRTGGSCVVAEPENKQALREALVFLKENDARFRILGNGSNTVAKDEGYDGVVVRTQKAFRECIVEGEKVTAGAGLMLSVVCKAALEASLTGLEFAYGIPGSVGGAVYMNAGAYDGEIKDVLESVSCYDIARDEFIVISADELKLSYRYSILHESRDLVVLGAVFRLNKGDKDTILAKMNDLMGRRVSKQPLDLPSCGSTFKRPVGSFAGKLIEECGLKGFRIGGAGVSDKHAGFVVNYENATSKDIFDVVRYVQDTVYEKTGYKLDCEIEVLE